MTGIPALLGALGLVALVFGFLNLIVGLFGAGIDPFWVGGNLAVGALLLRGGGRAERRVAARAARLGRGAARRPLSARARSSRRSLPIAILWLLGFLATRYPVRFDWSEQKVHSLSDQTTKLLAGLDSRRAGARALSRSRGPAGARDPRPLRLREPALQGRVRGSERAAGPAREVRDHRGAARARARARGDRRGIDAAHGRERGEPHQRDREADAHRRRRPSTSSRVTTSARRRARRGRARRASRARPRR